jgi:hypothetical protein
VSTDTTIANWGVYYLNYSFVPADAATTLAKAQAIVKDKDRIAALKLTAVQTKKLRDLSSGRSMSMSEADKTLLSAAVEECLKAPAAQRGALEPKVVKTLDEVAQRSMDATKQQVVDRATQIDTIMTPELWKANAALGGAP